MHSTKYYIVIPLTGLAIIMSNIILHLISNNRKTDNLHKTVHTHRNLIRLEMSRSKIQACSYFRVRVYNRLRGKFRYSRTWWRCYHLATAPPSKTYCLYSYTNQKGAQAETENHRLLMYNMEKEKALLIISNRYIPVKQQLHMSESKTQCCAI